MSEIADFIEAQYRRIEQAAMLMAEYYAPPWEVYDRGWMARVYGDREPFWEVTRLEQWGGMEQGTPDLGSIIEHIALHDPSRVLADIESKREILKRHDPVDPCDEHDASFKTIPCETVRLLAAPFSGEPGYKQEWAVE